MENNTFVLWPSVFVVECYFFPDLISWRTTTMGTDFQSFLHHMVRKSLLPQEETTYSFQALHLPTIFRVDVKYFATQRRLAGTCRANDQNAKLRTFLQDVLGIEGRFLKFLHDLGELLFVQGELNSHSF